MLFPVMPCARSHLKEDEDKLCDVDGEQAEVLFPFLCPNVFAHEEEHVSEHFASWGMHELLTKISLLL